MIRSALAWAAALCLVGCGERDADRAQPPPPNPALYELASSSGEVEGWLFGTIHALPDDTQWRTERLDRIVEQADTLIVEVAALEDSAAISRIFARLASGGESSALSDRVAPGDRAALAALTEKAGMDPAQFRNMDTWAAALTLARATATGDPGNGVDRALTAEFDGREVLELEGAERQLVIFDTLPERDQRDLLEAVIAESRAGTQLAARRVEDWRLGRIERIAKAADEGLLADPELRQTLLVARNRIWVEKLIPLLRDRPPLLVAVGAAHLPGDDGLVALLAQRGYTLRRIQ